jgi:hypothetical protein
MTTRLLVGDVFERMATLPDHSFDLIVTSPPFLALRSYLPDGHPDKAKEIGSEATPADYLDTLLALSAEWRRLLAPHGSIAVELGDTYAGSGGAGGDYDLGGLRAGQPKFRQAANWGDGKRGAAEQSTRSYGSGRGAGWPLDKSLTGIPTLYAWSLAYGRNLLTGQPSPAGRWRVRNLKPWIRSNPPVGALGDKERPATSYITVACVGASRWFDLDAVRTHSDYDRPNLRGNGSRGPGHDVPGQKHNSSDHTVNAGGAPPLDWWHQVDAVIDAEIDARARDAGGRVSGNRSTKRLDQHDGNWGTIGPYEGSNVGARGVHIRRALERAGILTTLDAYDVSPKGYSGMTRPTTRLVPCGPHDGGQRTTSRGCPVHGDRPAPAPTAPDDEHADSPATRTPHNSGRHVQGQLDDSAPTAPRTELTIELPNSDSLPQPCAPAATPHSTAANRTAPAPSTSPADTPFAETTGRTAHTSTSLSLTEPDPGTPSSRTGVGGQPLPESETDDDSARMSDPLAACTCSYHLAVKDEESTSHYAVWPPELVKLMISEMCPTRVCRECGEPSRRIVETVPTFDGKPMTAGKRLGTLGGKPSDTGVDHNRFRTERNTVGWSDCGHNTWRPGRILDPFVGSGTTLAVASGMGRDSTGIDIDERSADLARERVGMFLEVDYPDREVSA